MPSANFMRAEQNDRFDRHPFLSKKVGKIESGKIQDAVTYILGKKNVLK